MTSLQSLVASFEWHLKKKTYSASIMNDLVFAKARKILQSKQKQFEKQGKGNKPNLSVALTSDELKTYAKWFTRYMQSWRTFKYTMVKQQSSLWPWDCSAGSLLKVAMSSLT